MKLMHKLQTVVGLLVFCFLTPLQASQPLVDADWLFDNLKKPDLVVLDLQPAATYGQYHIPGAVHSSYADWRKPGITGVPQMMPSASVLEDLIGDLGIDNQTHVILVITGRIASEMAAATRVYWTFKALGHRKISILDGGLVAYAETRNRPLQQGSNPTRKRVFKAKLQSEYLITADIVNASLDSDVRIVDSRSGAEHMGLVSGGGEERAGTIPGSIPLPFDWLTINGGARFHTKQNLKRIYRASGVPLTGSQISFCHTGHRTSLSWFVSHELLGNIKAQMYDGSTAEWAANPTLPIEQKIKIN